MRARDSYKVVQFCCFVAFCAGEQVDEDDTSLRPWNNIAQHTRAIINFLYKAVSEHASRCCGRHNSTVDTSKLPSINKKNDWSSQQITD